MGSSLLEKAIDYSLKKGYLKSSEVDSVRQAIQGISKKYGMPEEWFVKTILIEAEGFYASKVAKNECAGIFQFCSWGTVVEGGGLKKEGYSLSEVFKLSPVEQTKLWDTYHLQVWLKQAARKPQSAAELYVINLFPAAFLAAAKGKLGINTPIRTVRPRAWGSQAKILYTDYNKGNSARLNSGNSEVTLASIERGLNLKIEELLKESFNNFANNALTVAQGALSQNPIIGAASTIANGLATLQSGIQSALLTGQNCPPPPYTQQDRIIYPGCLQKTSNPIYGNGLGSGAAAPGVNSINNQNTNGSQKTNNQTVGNSEPYTGELKPGGLINPMKKGTYTFTSPFGWRWGKMHKGVDLAASIGVPIYASADGIVERVHSSCPVNGFKGNSCGTSGFQGYGNIIYLRHQGMTTLYAHLSSVLVTQGQSVKQGQMIGKIGNSGSSLGAHIHYETRLNEQGAVNPERFIKF